MKTIVKYLSGMGILAFICLFQASAQSESQAKSILDKVASKNNGYKTIKADFKFSTSSTANNQSNVESGSVLIKGDKYHLILSNSDIIFDGKSVYTYLRKENEINITNPEPTGTKNGDFFFSNPRDIFKSYHKNFKSKLVQEITIGNVLCYEIDLYPIDLKTKYSRIRMHIVKSTLQIKDMKIFLKEGTQHFLEFLSFSPNTTIEDSEFIFNTQKYPNSEVNDMRF